MILPVSGRKPLAGSSVVIRHCSAKPRTCTESWVSSRSASVAPAGDEHLRLHQVDAGDLLGHGVLDLDAGVHLDEDVAALRVEQELDGAGVLVADLAGEAHRVGAHPLADLGVEVGRGGDLDDLLVAALHRAVALVEVDHAALGAGAVGEDLHLDVARVDDGLLDEDGRVAEGALGLAHAGLDRLAQVGAVVDLAHAAPAAAGDGLDEERGLAELLPEGLGGRHERVDVGGRVDRGEGRYAGGLGRGDRARLVAGQGQHLGAGADEGDAGRGAGLGEGRVLRQEAVAGVDRVGAALHGDRDDRVGVEVGAHRVPGLADLVGLLGLHPVLGPAVLVGEDGHRPGADLARGSEGPDCDLAAVGDEDLGEHGPNAIE